MQRRDETLNVNPSILVIRLSSMGDVLLVTPLLRRLRRKFPKGRIDVVSDSRFGELLRHNPHISHLFEYQKDASQEKKEALRKELQSNHYVYVLDLQRNRHSRFLRPANAGYCLKMQKYRIHKLATVYTPLRLATPPLVPDRYTQTAAMLSLETDEEGLELWLEDEKESTSYPPAERQAPSQHLLTLAPGARHFTKRWQPEKFAQTAEILRKKHCLSIAVVGGIDDKKEMESLLLHLGKCGIEPEEVLLSHSIADTANLLDRTTLFVCNDTGVMHIAAARQVPTIAIFGSTVKELGFTPYNAPHAIAEADISCRPCTHIGKNACPRKHFRCMSDIFPEYVARLAEAFL